MATKNTGLVRPPKITSTIAVGSLAINFLALGLPIILLQIFDRIVPNRAEETMVVLFGALILSLGMDFVLKVARIMMLGRHSADYERDLTERAIGRILDADTYQFAKDPTGTHLDRLAAIGQLRDHYGGQGRLLSIDLPFTIIFIGMIWFIGGWLVLVPIACLIGVAVLSVVLRIFQAPIISTRQSIDRRRYSFLLEVLGNITTVKSLMAEDQMLRRFERLQDQSADATRGMVWIASISQTFGAVFGQIAVVAMGAFGAFLNITGQIGMAELAACMLLNGRTIQPMLKLLALWAQIEGLRSSEARVGEIADLPQPAGFSQYKGAFEPRVRFQDVSLQIPGQEKPVFEKLSFTVEPGEFAQIVGDDGAGKSSLMRMILGEQHPTTGRVRIDRDNARALIARRDVGEIAYVDQDPVIFDGTILENLSLYGDRARQDAAVFAAEKIGLEAEVIRLPRGYETEIGPSSQTVLPTGMLQKISIARVLGRRPELLLFNNAASAIDGASRIEVARGLTSLRGRTTLIFVSTDLVPANDIDQRISLTPENVVSNSASLKEWLSDAEQDRAPIRLRPQKAIGA